jgi:hypothetical protein
MAILVAPQQRVHQGLHFIISSELARCSLCWKRHHGMQRAKELWLLLVELGPRLWLLLWLI